MATFQDNITTIQTAVYGKEMRPAISEALTQSWAEVINMAKSVDRLSKRIDALTGESGGGDAPIDLEPPFLVVYGAITSLGDVGNPEFL